MAAPTTNRPKKVPPLIWIAGDKAVGGFSLQIVEDRVTKLLPLDLPDPLSTMQNHCTDSQAKGHDAQDDRSSQGRWGESRGWGTSPVGPLKAWAHWELTARAHETWGTLADRATEVCITRAAILTLVHQAGICTNAAILAGETQCASTYIIVDTINTCAGIVAGDLGTVVHVDATVGSSEAWTTTTEDTLTQIHTVAPWRKTEP